MSKAIQNASLFFMLIIVLGSSAYAAQITQFKIENIFPNTLVNPPDNEGAISIERGYCAYLANMTISASSDARPRIDFGKNYTYEFEALVGLPPDGIRWVNDYCDNPTDNTYLCHNFAKVINHHLTLCNNNPGTEPCDVSFFFESRGTEATLSNLKIGIAEAYLGPRWGGDENSDGDRYTCDGLVVCEEGEDAASCLYGDPADTMVSMQRTHSMVGECDFAYDGNFDSDCDQDNEYIYRSLARDLATVAFAYEYFTLSPGNRMGVVPQLATSPGGQQVALTNNMDEVIAQMEQKLGETRQFCLSCTIALSTKYLVEGGLPDSTKSILLMTDGFSDRCIQEGDGYGSQCQKRPAGMTAEEAAREESIRKACYAYDQHGIVTYTVAFGLNADEEGLRLIAACSGEDNFFRATNLDDLLEIYKEIARRVSGDCEGLCSFTNLPPPQPDPFCGDGNVSSTDPPKECDWGTANVPVELIEEQGYACIPDPGAECRICTSECKWMTNQSTDYPPPEQTYCGDGIVQSPNQREGIEEQCDEGTDVNTDVPCVPVPGGTCYICSTNCQNLSFDRPTTGLCPTFDASTPVDLSRFVSFPGGRNIDLKWEYVSNTSISDYEITPNNVLTVSLIGNVGQIILRVSDDEDNTDLACINFIRTRRFFGLLPPPFTRLQIAKGRIVSGFYEQELTGRVIEYGPYLITAQVWQK
jgi:hypothetical protein